MHVAPTVVPVLCRLLQFHVFIFRPLLDVNDDDLTDRPQCQLCLGLLATDILLRIQFRIALNSMRMSSLFRYEVCNIIRPAEAAAHTLSTRTLESRTFVPRRDNFPHHLGHSPGC